MKIDIYTLLGMIKDKKAPKKIKYCGHIWKFCNNGAYSSYWFNDIELQDYLDGNILENLNDTVEILEEEKKIPEKLFFTHISNYNDQSVVNNNFNNYFKKTQETINQLIDYLDYLKSKGE